MVTPVVRSVVGMTATLISLPEPAVATPATATQTARALTATDRVTTATAVQDRSSVVVTRHAAPARAGTITPEIGRALTEAAMNVRPTPADRRSDRVIAPTLTAVSRTGPSANPAHRMAGTATSPTAPAVPTTALVSTVLSDPARLIRISAGPATTTGKRTGPTNNPALAGTNARTHRANDQPLTATTEHHHAMAMRGLTVTGLPVRVVRLSDHALSVGMTRTANAPVILRVPDRIGPTFRVPGHSIGTTTAVTAVPIQHVPVTTATATTVAERVVPAGADQTNQPVRRIASNG